MMLHNNLRWSLLCSGDHVLVAVSGGPDSLSLLHVLWTEREAHQLGSVTAAHLDHGLRGDESAAEAAWVAAWCGERGIVCHVGKADTAAWAREHRQSVQEAARAVRYEFLEQTAAAIGADKIATGHTRDDQAETVLANILRGSGLDGLRGISEQRGLIVRPLLDVSRRDVEAHCAAHGLEPRQDPSNLSSDHYTRNRLRLELLPQLRADYNPRVEEALVRLSEIAARDSDYMTAQASAALADATRDSHILRLELDRAALAALHPALLRHVLRLAIANLRGTGEGVTYEHLEAICYTVISNSSKAFVLVLPHPICTVRVTARTLSLTLASVPISLAYVSMPLPLPGEALLAEINWCVSAGWEAQPGAVAFDAAAVDLSSLVARTWRTGDRIDPVGMEGRHKKLSDIFIDAKVPCLERNRVPIVADDRGVVWVIGHALSDRAKVTEATTRILYLTAQNPSRKP